MTSPADHAATVDAAIQHAKMGRDLFPKHPPSEWVLAQEVLRLRALADRATELERELAEAKEDFDATDYYADYCEAMKRAKAAEARATELERERDGLRRVALASEAGAADRAAVANHWRDEAVRQEARAERAETALQTILTRMEDTNQHLVRRLDIAAIARAALGGTA